MLRPEAICMLIGVSFLAWLCTAYSRCLILSPLSMPEPTTCNFLQTLLEKKSYAGSEKPLPTLFNENKAFRT